MPSMPTDFWSGWIVVLTLGSLAGLAWLVFSIYFSNHNAAEFKSPIWDETLQEGNNPAPMWWFWMILTALVISVIYLMLYPGLGSYSGALKWTQGGRLDKKLVLYAYEHVDTNNAIIKSPIVELQNDKQFMNSAKRLFTQNCSACHGMQAQGQANTFPSLIDEDWQWGKSEAMLEQTIRHGRQAVMVGWLAVIGEEGVIQVRDYVKNFTATNHSPSAEKGKVIYQQFCFACHGSEGEGNQTLGAPNLVDDIWLYGNSDAQLHTTISKGRSGIMPAFDKRLSDAQIKMLVAWLSR
jgi:cytochrome c oxidase cbb3-type subunit 3